MSTYNGWKNYATWRVNLELFDDLPLEHLPVHPEDFLEMDPYERAQILKEYTLEAMEMYPDGFVKDYALAFIYEVDFLSIAQHMGEQPAQ